MPTIESLFLLVLSILSMESADSIRSLYKHFLTGITKKSLNAFYYACSYATADYSRFMNITAGMDLKLIPEKLSSQPAFLCIDDTMVSNSGSRRLFYSTIFPEQLQIFCACQEKSPPNQAGIDGMQFIPPVPLRFPMEHQSQLLWAKAILVALQLYGQKPQRH